MAKKATVTVRTTMTKSCPVCKRHDFQDSVFGQNVRLHNLAKGKGVGVKAWTCTVCGTKREV